ncbi:MAG TPA: hypothetical protein VGC41_25630 [Kofleriaceae bacterium]
MPKHSKPPSFTPPLRSTRQWSVSEKLRVLGAADQASEQHLGELLRREGVHEADLQQWRSELGDVLQAQSSAARTAEKRLNAVEAELREVRALLELQKKVDALYGQGDAAASSPTKQSGT